MTWHLATQFAEGWPYNTVEGCIQVNRASPSGHQRFNLGDRNIFMGCSVGSSRFYRTMLLTHGLSVTKTSRPSRSPMPNAVVVGNLVLRALGRTGCLSRQDTRVQLYLIKQLTRPSSGSSSPGARWQRLRARCPFEGEGLGEGQKNFTRLAPCS